jgi:hypothetical protein
MLRSPHKGAVNRKENNCKAKSRDQRKIVTLPEKNTDYAGCCNQG